MDIIGVQGMTKLQSLGIVAIILILVGAVAYFLDAPSLSVNSGNGADYQGVTFDALSQKDMDFIAAAKLSMANDTSVDPTPN